MQSCEPRLLVDTSVTRFEAVQVWCPHSDYDDNDDNDDDDNDDDDNDDDDNDDNSSSQY